MNRYFQLGLSLFFLLLPGAMVSCSPSDEESQDVREMNDPTAQQPSSGGSGNNELPATEPGLPSEILCDDLNASDPQLVQVTRTANVNLEGKGGEIEPGIYEMTQALRPHGVDVSQEQYRKRWTLLADGTGMYTRKLGLSVWTSKISWSTDQEKFTYQTLCPDTEESLTFDYTYDNGQLSFVISDTLQVFESRL